MLPPFDPASGNLPPGVHEAAWDEIEARFGWSPRRRRLLAGLRRALDALKAAGCRRVYIDGSFVTAEQYPNDYDACWEAAEVDFDRLDPVFLEFRNQRVAQKGRFWGE